MFIIKLLLGALILWAMIKYGVFNLLDILFELTLNFTVFVLILSVILGGAYFVGGIAIKLLETI